LYQHHADLGADWNTWTGLPFIFGVWVADRAAFEQKGGPGVPCENPATLLCRSRNWGMEHLERILDIAEQNYPNMTRQEHADYFAGLGTYALGVREQAGLRLFWQKLAAAGEIPLVPEMRFLSL
jgi:chorismate dehydratase